jgi:hypothetical protein
LPNQKASQNPLSKGEGRVFFAGPRRSEKLEVACE